MIITCEACSTSFNLDEKILKPEGSKVRCSVCSNVFTAYPKQVPPSASENEPAVKGAVSRSPDRSEQPEVDEQAVVDDASLSPESSADASLEEELTDDKSAAERKPTANENKDNDAGVVEEEMDRELDLFLDVDSADESDATVIADLDADDLDLSLNLEPREDETAALTLDDDDFDLNAPLATEDDPEGTETILADLDDGVLELEDDLDLSALESMLDEHAQESGKEKAEALEESAPELSFDLEDKPTAKKNDTKTLDQEGESDLELAVATEEVGDSDDSGNDDQEIDLSDIEKMLEEPSKEGVATSTVVPDQDLELDVEAGLDPEKWMTKDGQDEMLVEDDEIDLTELEQVLDDVDSNEKEPASDEPELALDIEEDAETETEKVQPVLSDDLELDFSDLQDDVQFIDSEKDSDRDADDMELTFEVETDTEADQTLEQEPVTPAVSAEPQETKASYVPPPPPEPSKKATETTPVAETETKGTSKFLVFLLIVLLLGGAGYGGYYLIYQKGVEIPFLSDYLKPKTNDPGNLKLSTHEINSRFVDNANVGKLFVISGKVKNGYAESRGMITLEGKLFSEGKVPVNQEKVYCGNVMSDLELSNLEWDQIKARLSNRLGDNRSNVKVEPGESIPFMVVFSGLPDDLEEFTIEVTGSTVLQ